MTDESLRCPTVRLKNKKSGQVITINTVDIVHPDGTMKAEYISDWERVGEANQAPVATKTETDEEIAKRKARDEELRKITSKIKNLPNVAAVVNVALEEYGVELDVSSKRGELEQDAIEAGIAAYDKKNS